MTNEEAAKIIESVGPDSSVYGWRKVADAFNLAIKALENQSKYEKALHLATADSLVFDLGQTDEAREQMVSNVARDYKRRAGIKE